MGAGKCWDISGNALAATGVHAPGFTMVTSTVSAPRIGPTWGPTRPRSTCTEAAYSSALLEGGTAEGARR